MSAEELKIRDELERDVERDLEEEIKDGIYHLALRLHRLYQHQNERIGRELPRPGTKNQQGMKNETLSELNINIKMEGGTKIEIKEVKKEAHQGERPKSAASRPAINVQKMAGPDTKEFNWAKSLRSKPKPVCVKKKNESSHQAKVLNHGSNLHENAKLNKVIRNYMSASIDNKVLELGWKN
ncbi:hypothetical protein LguiA_005347 [Lonicera macranthoides]